MTEQTLPIPTGTRLLIRMYQESDKLRTSTGVELYRPQERTSVEQDAAMMAEVLDLGDEAYQATLARPAMTPYCSKGDWVLVPSFCGSRIMLIGDKAHYRIIQDTAVLARVPNPDMLDRYSAA